MSGRAGLRYALGRVYHGEHDLARQLLQAAGRHHDDHEIRHVARDLAGWSQEHLSQITRSAAGHDIRIGRPGPGRPLARTASGIIRRPEPGLLLLEDLSDLYLGASQTSLAWEMLAQYAQAGHEEDILKLAGRCHPQTLRQMRWCNTMLKTLSPQVLTSL